MGQNATFIKLKIGVKVLVGETSSSFSSSSDILDKSSKASARVRRILPGRYRDEVTFDSMADDTNSTDYGFKDAHTAAKAGTILEWSIVRGAVEIASGVGFLTSLNKNNNDNELTTFSGTIRVTQPTA